MFPNLPIHALRPNATGFCYIGNNVALCLYPNGVYSVHCGHGSFKKISDTEWKTPKGAAYVGNNKVVALCDGGIYSIDCTNGSYSKIADSKWPVRGVGVHAGRHAISG